MKAKKPIPSERSLDALSDADFEHYESGKLRAGIRWVNTQDGPQCPGECYQFDTLQELLSRARAFQNDKSIVSFSLVTHRGQYVKMRTVYTWAANPLENLFERFKLPVGELAIREQGGGDTPANRLRAGRNLAAVQRLQSEFWQALRELEDVIGEMRGDTCELDGAKDFNDLDLDNVIEGHGDDGEEGGDL